MPLEFLLSVCFLTAGRNSETMFKVKKHTGVEKNEGDGYLFLMSGTQRALFCELSQAQPLSIKRFRCGCLVPPSTTEPQNKVKST